MPVFLSLHMVLLLQMDVDINDGKDRIGPMYRDRHVLITGGTGFMGKALIEKLLR